MSDADEEPLASNTYTVKNIAYQLIGWVLIVLGAAGLFLPLLPGTPLLVLGLIVLSREYVWARRLMTRLRDRFPEVSRKAEAWWRRMRFRWESGSS
jgi:uncharacterized membrane protein YbaN (DUF454 family)